MAERILNAYFNRKTDGAVTVVFESTAPIIGGRRFTLYRGGEKIATALSEKSDLGGCFGTVTFKSVRVDFGAQYSVKPDGAQSAVRVSFRALVDDKDFISVFENADTQSVSFGASYSKKQTVFRLWAPFAASVKLKLYEDGTAGRASITAAMKKRETDGVWGGVWEIALDGDYDGKYYTYAVNNYGRETETIDPYARACGANGLRGMVIDLSRTNPMGWEQDKHLCKTNAAAADTPVIWETSVSDFSASPDSGMKYKGKYLAFTESGTTVPGTDMKTGVDYLKELGVTYVHLNPVYDFATVDEGDMTRADNTHDAFNWGYDPQNYNIPEGSFSTDAAIGDVRIREFKGMVMALHKAGIGVIMDVVYNHTYSTGGQALFDAAPYYYHRTDENGRLTNDSGCGNGTASERTMMRKYMVESVLYWAKEYHIDGFRFDLMGIHDVVTLNTIRAELDKIDKRILMYGEPWSADGDYTPASYTNRINSTEKHIAGTGRYTLNKNNRLMKHVFSSGFGDETAFDVLSPRIAVFNGSGRDGLRGACHDKKPQKGWVNGDPSALGRVKRMIEGGIGGYADGLYTGLASRNVAYAAAHDNYTLWDHIRGAAHGEQSALYYDFAERSDIKRCMIVAAAYMMSTGICFMLAGEEMGRTKYGNEDSYNSPQKLNAIAWSRRSDFSSLTEFYKELIALRKKHSEALFSYKKSTEKEFAFGVFEEVDYETGRFVFTRQKNGVTLKLMLDPSTLEVNLEFGIQN